MIFGKNFVFAHLQKTGGTYCTNFLKSEFPNSIITKKKHETMHKFLSKEKERNYLIGTIRDPLALYVSLWSYGCQGQGGLFKRLTNRTLIQDVVFTLGLIKSGKIQYHKIFTNRKNEIYKHLYSDANNISNFQDWLKLIHLDESFFDVGLKVPSYMSSGEKIGLMSRRFLKTYCNYNVDSENRIIESSVVILVNYWINMENMNDDLSNVIMLISNAGEYKNSGNINNYKLINTSVHKDYNVYYTNELKSFVLEVDKIIYEKDI